MYPFFGSAKAPHQLFDRIPNRGVIHPNPDVPFLARSERGDDPTVSCIIRAITSLRSEDLIRGIHSAVIKIGFEWEIPIATALIGFYSSIRDLDSARRLFYATPTKDLILWSAMVSVCCKNGQFSMAINTFSKMQHFGVVPNCVSLMSVLPACANAGALRHGKQIHGLSIRRGFHKETSLQNSLLDMYAKCGMLDAAILVFNGIKEKDVISWKNIMFGCTSNGQPRKALLLFSGMRNSYMEPDVITVRNVIGVCSQVRDRSFGLALHCYTIKNGLFGSSSVGTALLGMYAEFRELETARALFDRLHHKDLIAWSAIVSVYSHSGHPVLALEMFKQMQLGNEEANERTLVSLLHTCSLMEAQELGRSIHACVTRLGYTSNMYLTSALIDFYCKIGMVRQGETLFDKTQSRDLVCWSSMIKGYGINGRGEEAIRTFLNMLEYGLIPNEIVFISLLSACGHCGLVDEGWKWFYSMKEKFGISPILEHYTCIVDMLGRQGQAEEALKFVNMMPMEPDVSVWGALLSWCRTKYSDVNVAEIVAEQLIRLDPANTSYYVTLSNMYSKLGQWDDAERIRGSMEEKGLRKTAGYSMV